MLTERYVLYCSKQVKDRKDIDFPRQANSSWVVCYLDFSELEDMRCGSYPREASKGREIATLRSHSQICPVPLSTWDLKCWLSSHSLLLKPTPYPFTTQWCVFCSFTPGDRHWWRAWFVVPQPASAVASWLAEGEMLWCLSVLWDFLKGQRIPRCSPLLQPSPMGWTVQSCLLSSVLLGGPEQIEKSVCCLY